METFSKSRKYIKAGRGPKGNLQGHSGRKAKIKEAGKPANGFLTSVFKPVHATEVNPLFQAGNYDYLYRSAKKYASLLGESFVLEPDPKDFEAVCDKLDALLPKGQEARLFVKDNRIHFKIINSIHEYLLFYIPCKIIDESEGVFRELLTEFFRLFQHEQRLTPLLESQNFEMWREELDYYYERTGEEPDDWLAALRSYTQGGTGETLKLVADKPRYTADGLLEAIGSYAPLNKDEKKLLDHIRKGLGFLKAGKIALHHTHLPRSCDEERAVGADNLLMIVYDTDDAVVENMIHYMNEYAMEVGYEFFSSVNKTLTTRTRSLAEEDRFILGFFDWINDFTYALRNR